MDLLTLLKAIVMGIVEGLTEFLPISSTGHLIVAGHMLAFPDAIANTFEIFIQLGAILAVVVFFFTDLRNLLMRALKQDRAAINLLIALVVAFVPAAVIGLLFRKQIKASLFNPTTVAIALIVGGVAMLLVERWLKGRQAAIKTLDQVGVREAIGIGLVQVLSLVPGTSRSMTTILGGLFMGLDRITAARFSFYLAIPTLGLASLYELVQEAGHLRSADLLLFLVGLVVSFVVAWVVIKWMLSWISRHDFSAFGWYRIAAGAAMLLFFAPVF